VPSSESSRIEKMPQPVSGPCVLLYDGECGLCGRTVRWLLRHDTHGRLLFAPLQQTLDGEVFAGNALPSQPISSAVLVMNFGEPGERVVVRSDAILGCLSVLGGGWALLAAVARLVPRLLRDIAYNWLARNRHWLFADGECCALPTAAERARFLNI
jgi:predicted DCC family thiol-disulfide oxidoreductase YuxK